MNDDNFKELKEFVEFLFDLVNVYDKAKADGKLSLTDLQYLPGLFFSAQSGFNHLGNPVERWKAMTEADRLALIELAKTRFDLPNDELEMLFERWFDAGLVIADLVHDTVAFVRRDDASDAS